MMRESRNWLSSLSGITPCFMRRVSMMTITFVQDDWQGPWWQSFMHRLSRNGWNSKTDKYRTPATTSTASHRLPTIFIAYLNIIFHDQSFLFIRFLTSLYCWKHLVNAFQVTGTLCIVWKQICKLCPISNTLCFYNNETYLFRIGLKFCENILDNLPTHMAYMYDS